jgi:hypothetical protein
MASLQFNCLLGLEGIDPAKVIALRHRPKEKKLRRVLPWLAAEQPNLFNAYQQVQGPKLEKAFLSIDFIAAFIGYASGRAVFVGLFRRKGQELVTRNTFLQKPAVKRLTEMGMADADIRDTRYWFDLERTDLLRDYIGRLVINWPGGELSWWRRSERNHLQVLAISEHDTLTTDVPLWTSLF